MAHTHGRSPWLRWAVVAVVLAGCVAAFAGRQYLSWDASYQLVFMLQWDGFFVVKDRWAMAVLQMPARLAQSATDELPVLVGAYGLLYSFVPAICVALVARILRARDGLFVLSVLGICACTLLYQYHWLAEHLIACQLAWVLLALLSRNARTVSSTAGVAVVAGLIFALHPVAALLLGIAAGLCLMLDRRATYNRTVASVLAIGAVARALLLTGSPDDQRFLDPARVVDAILLEAPMSEWVWERNLPLAYLLLCSLAAGLALVPAMRARKARWVRWVVLAAAAGCLFGWLLGDGQSLAYALRIRHTTSLACIVPYAAFVWLALRPGVSRRQPPASAWLSPGFALAIAVMFFAFLTQVSAMRQRQLAAADEWLRDTGASCRPMLSYARDRRTFLEHWAMTYEHLLYVGARRPSAMFVDGRECDFSDAGEVVRLTRFAVPFEPEGYFDFGEVVGSPPTTAH